MQAEALARWLVRRGELSLPNAQRARGRQRVYGGTLDTVVLELGLLTEAPLHRCLSEASGLPAPQPVWLHSPWVSTGRLIDATTARRLGAQPVARSPFVDRGEDDRDSVPAAVVDQRDWEAAFVTFGGSVDHDGEDGDGDGWLETVVRPDADLDAAADWAAARGFASRFYVVPEVRLEALIAAIHDSPLPSRHAALLARMLGPAQAQRLARLAPPAQRRVPAPVVDLYPTPAVAHEAKSSAEPGTPGPASPPPGPRPESLPEKVAPSPTRLLETLIPPKPRPPAEITPPLALRGKNGEAPAPDARTPEPSGPVIEPGRDEATPAETRRESPTPTTAHAPREAPPSEPIAARDPVRETIAPPTMARPEEITPAVETPVGLRETQDVVAAAIHEEITRVSPAVGLLALREGMLPSPPDPPAAVHDEITRATLPSAAVHEEITRTAVPSAAVHDEITRATLPSAAVHEEITRAALPPAALGLGADPTPPPLALREDVAPPAVRLPEELPLPIARPPEPRAPIAPGPPEEITPAVALFRPSVAPPAEVTPLPRVAPAPEVAPPSATKGAARPTPEALDFELDVVEEVPATWALSPQGDPSADLDIEVDLQAVEALAPAPMAAPPSLDEAISRLAEAPIDDPRRPAWLAALRSYATDPRVQTCLRTWRAEAAGVDGPALAAMSALAALRDPQAVPLLLAHVTAADAVASEARDALVTVTRHDFGRDGKRWQRWWQTAREQDRPAWLLDALDAETPALRLEAARELEALSGRYVGYHFDLDRRHRRAASRRWRAWWQNRPS